jgi:YfiH family protein
MEQELAGPVPIFCHPGWRQKFPWLVQGTTARGAGEGFDLRLSGEAPVGGTLGRWRQLRETLGFHRAVHAGQVHGTRVLHHRAGGAAGLLITDTADGHATDTPGVLLTVSIADCIPISIVDPERRAIALLHGGWRGVAAGMIEEGLAALRAVAGSEPESLYLHLGPAICGDCYEVGPEVHTALGLEEPPHNQPIDLRAIAARKATQLGVEPERITTSTFCTRCAESPFYSYRAGSKGRQVGVLGIRREW